MADVKISQLPAAASIASTDVAPVVTGGVTSKVTAQAIVNGGLSGGTANGVLYLDGSKAATSGSALVFDGTNLGIGVTPSAWSAFKAIDVSNVGSLAVYPSFGVAIYRNAYYDGSVYRYKISSAASFYDQASNGVHSWYTAPSGTAGDAISFSQVMTLDANGRLALGSTSILGGTNIASFTNPTTAKGVLAIQNTSTSGYSAVELYDNAGSQQGAMGWGNASVAVTGVASATYLYSTGAITFLSGGTTERARIDSSGSWLVAKTASNSTTPGFEVRKVDASTTTMYVTTPGYYSALFNRQSDDGETIVFQRQNSSVGTISVTTTATAYNTSSDYRLKNITGPVTNSGAYIDSLKPVEGTWKANGSAFVGLLAHEAQEVSRTSVATGEKDGEQMQGMDYSNSEFIANIIAELQSLRARVASLESK